MNRISVPLYLASMLLPIAALGAPEKGLCTTGTLLDVQMNTGIIQAGTSEHGQQRIKKNGRKEYDSYSTNYQRKQITYTVTVRLDDLVYTAESATIFGFGFKPTSFVVNDPIRACLQGNTLALSRPDGKEYKAHIIRAARLPATDSQSRQ